MKPFIIQVILVSPFIYVGNLIARFGMQDWFKKNPEYYKYRVTIEFAFTLMILAILAIVNLGSGNEE